MDRHGTVLREVAPAQFLLTRPDRNDKPLKLVVALIRDLSRTVFNNRQLNRDLLAVCQRVNELQPKLPDGRLLILHAPSLPFG